MTRGKKIINEMFEFDLVSIPAVYERERERERERENMCIVLYCVSLEGFTDWRNFTQCFLSNDATPPFLLSPSHRQITNTCVIHVLLYVCRRNLFSLFTESEIHCPHFSHYLSLSLSLLQRERER